MTKSAPARLDYLPAEEGFLEPDRADAKEPAKAKAVVIPFGLEASVSYGHGTAKGPLALLAASHQLELFDEELWREPVSDYGVATLRPQPIPETIAPALEQLAATVGAVLDQGRFPMVIGGEHSLTPGAIRPYLARHPDLVVLQFDAHADLRDGYQGEHFSHASAMRRVLDNPGVSLVSIGIRAISAPEAAFIDANPERVQIFWGKDQARWDTEEIVRRLRGRPVYVTFDIDALDSAQMPATGTPTPGGLSYLQAMAILRRAAEVSKIVGADVVELAPIPGFHAFDYTAALITYKILSYALSGTGVRTCPPRR